MLVEEKEQIVNHSGNPVASCQDVQPIALANKAVLDLFGHLWTCDKRVKVVRI